MSKRLPPRCLVLAFLACASTANAAEWKPCGERPPVWVRGDRDLIDNHGFCNGKTHTMVLYLPGAVAGYPVDVPVQTITRAACQGPAAQPAAALAFPASLCVETTLTLMFS